MVNISTNKYQYASIYSTDTGKQETAMDGQAKLKPKSFWGCIKNDKW